MTSDEITTTANAAGRTHRTPLTRREREVLGLLAGGMSGAQIAAELFLSPETVRTHIRNAMAKLGASTRSQAVALALQRDEIASEPSAPSEPVPGQRAPARRLSAQGTQRDAPAEVQRALGGMLAGLASLYDLDGGAVYIAEEDGMMLRRAAATGLKSGGVGEIPQTLALGEGPLGKVALGRRAQLVSGLAASTSEGGGVLAAPILADGRLLGVLALATRTSRPTGRSELLLLQALANRVGEVLRNGTDVDRQLDRAVERFGASWSGATHS
jgi:DNA-binding CsgD family transcriptional regulator